MTVDPVAVGGVLALCVGALRAVLEFEFVTAGTPVASTADLARRAPPRRFDGTVR